MQSWGSATWVKRGCNTSVFLWNLWKFSEHIFWRTSANDCFWIYVNDPTIYIAFVHFVILLYENMYGRKVLFLTLMNSFIFLQALFLFSDYYKRSIYKTWTCILVHNFPLIYYTHVLLGLVVMTYDISYNIQQLSVCTFGLCYLLPTGCRRESRERQHQARYKVEN